MKKIFFILSLTFAVQCIVIPIFASYRITQHDEYTVFLVKQMWHTGIVFNVEAVDTLVWPEINAFKNYQFVDVGWGDSAFYQNPNFNIEQAAAALFAPTPSTLRIYGFDTTFTDIINNYDKVAEIKLSRKKFTELCKYVHNTYSKSKSGKVIIYKKEYNGSVIFYKANGKYDIFNTCNTWVAKGLNKIGFKQINSGLILEEELFRQARKIGKILK